MSEITIAVYGGELATDEVIEISGAEQVGNDWIIRDMDAAAIAEAWAKDHPVARSWSVAPNNGLLVLVDHTQEGRPITTFWARAGADQYLLGAAPFGHLVRVFRRELSDHEALGHIRTKLLAGGATAQELASIIESTGRPVLIS